MHDQGKSIDVPGCVFPGNGLVTWDSYAGRCQQFALTGQGSGYYGFQSRTSTLAVDQVNCGSAPGTVLRDWYLNWSNCQQESFEDATGTGQYVIRSRASGLVYDVAGGGTANGTAVRMWTANGCACQQFLIKPASDSGLQLFLTNFTVDTTAPGAPTVTSATYPNDNTWHGGANVAGTVTVSASAAQGAVSAAWGLDKAPDPNAKIALTNGAGSFQITPTTDGKHVVNVAVFDTAGNQSAVVRYDILVGRAGLVSPDDGDRAVRRTRLAVSTSDSTLNYVQFWYRRGPDDTAPKKVPLSRLTQPDGTALTADWTPLSSLAGGCPANAGNAGDDTVRNDFCAGTGGFAVWDAGLTLGAAGGPVQVQARMATDATGAGQLSTSQWVGLVIDPDADSAASSDIGPGSVNLLTGDFTLSGEDAKEFGLSLGRTASSRDTGAGYQLQSETLKASQTTIDASTTLGSCGTANVSFAGCGGVSLVRSTSRGHGSTTAGAVDSLELRGDGSTGTQTFASVGDDAGGLRLGMHPGGRYRASAWFYVPGTGTDPGAVPAAPSYGGAGLLATWVDGNGSQSVASSNHPNATNTWQQVSLDFTVPSGATQAYLRVTSGYAANSGQSVFVDDLSLRELWAPLGPQWKLAAQDANTDGYESLAFPEPGVAEVRLAGGGKVWFSSNGSNTSRWYPEPGAENLTLTNPSASVWRLADVDGTVTQFEKNKDSDTDWAVSLSSPPVGAGQARYVYEYAGTIKRLQRIIAPIETGVDGYEGANPNACTTATPARGCEVLELVYASATTATASTPGDFSGQLQKVRAWSFDGSGVDAGTTGDDTAVDVLQYRYDVSGRLVQVFDPRLPSLITTYGYDGGNRVSTLTPPGESAWTFVYGTAGPTTTGSDDLVDNNGGRLLTVRRPSLMKAKVGDPNFNTETTAVSSNVVYRVPLTRTAGGPYDLGPAAIRTWGQVEAPTDATAIFGPDSPEPLHTATATSPTAADYSLSTVSYLNASGKSVNSATPTGNGSDTTGDIDTTEYDRFGNTVRRLDATNRRLALGALPDASQRLAELGMTGISDTAIRALALSTVSTYSNDGLDELSSTGPVQSVVSTDGSQQIARIQTRTTYDEGKPDGAAYHLATTVTRGALLVGGAKDGQVVDTETTVNGYNPVDGADPLGPTSGWKHGQPTSVTGNATGAPGERVVAQVIYDNRGRSVESRKNSQTSAATSVASADAGTVKTFLFTANASSTEPTCRNRPEWAGSPCLTRVGGDPSGVAADRMAPSLPIKQVTKYDRFGNPMEVRDSATGPVAGTTVTMSRLTTTQYDVGGRVTSVEIKGTSGNVGTSVRTTTTYDDSRGGDATVIKGYLNGAPDGSESNIITKTYDKLGRLAQYNDGAGNITDTIFDGKGKPDTVSDSTGASTRFAYNDPRGLLTDVTDSVAGTITATYGPDGQVTSQSLPGGVKLDLKYDAAGTKIGRTHSRTSDGQTIAASSVRHNTSGQWASHTTTASSKQYTYDGLGRLTGVQDTLASTGVCTQRTYTYNLRAGRTSKLTTRTPAGSPTCGDATQTGATSARSWWTYDTADRLVSTTGDTASSAWTYDPLGRITKTPVESNPGATLANGFYANDRAASQQIDGIAKQTWTLDALQRASRSDNSAWANGQWANAVSKANH